MLFDGRHFDRGFGQLRKIFARSDGIAEKEKVARAFAVRGVRGLQYSQRAGARDRGILNPVVWRSFVFGIELLLLALGCGDQQRFEIQAVQGAIGDDENFPFSASLGEMFFGRRSFAGSTRMR